LNALLPWKDIVSEGGFTTVDAARLIGQPAEKIAAWLRGTPPIVLPDFEPINGRIVMSFEALIEARAIAHFVDQGVKPSRLRTIMNEVRKTTGHRHPLARDLRTVTDGFRVFEKDGDRLINLANDVYAHPTIMAPALKGRVEFAGGKAAFLVPEPEKAPLVRIDPRHAFGRPVIFDSGRIVTTSALAASVEVEGLEDAAEWFGVSPEAARQAQEYELQIAA
jgi:hypothetical protein